MRIQLFFLYSILILLFSSCEKELDIKYHEIDPILVIEGNLTQKGAEVSLTFTTPMNDPINLTRLTDATVSITDLSTGLIENLIPNDDGLFCSITPGIVGHQYELHVEHDGSRYSSGTVMLPSVEISNIELKWIKMPYDDVATIKISVRENFSNPDNYVWVRLYRNGEPYSWYLASTAMAVNGKVDLTVMLSRKNTDEEDEKSVLYDGDIIDVTATLLDKKFGYYLEALSNDSNGEPQFEGDKALGYFLASEVDEKEIIFRRDEIEYD